MEKVDRVVSLKNSFIYLPVFIGVFYKKFRNSFKIKAFEKFFLKNTFKNYLDRK
jgi:hypothetical protein